MINWVAVGTRIQTKRLEKKMTQQQLAELTDYSEVYIGYIEQGKRKLSIESMIRTINGPSKHSRGMWKHWWKVAM